MPNTVPEGAVHVAAGVILHGRQVLLARRLKHTHQGGLWEFPGGKIEAGEAGERALARELREELGIEVRETGFFVRVAHDYGDKHVVLDVWLVTGFDGDARGQEGQEVRWVELAELASLDFPAANEPILQKLLREL